MSEKLVCNNPQIQFKILKIVIFNTTKSLPCAIKAVLILYTTL